MGSFDYVCPICGNSDINKIGFRNGKPYCRLCLTFKGKEANYFKTKGKLATFNLTYDLSKEQKELSNQLLNNFKKGLNSLVHAVCGSGKTEIVLSVIQYAINVGYKVGFAVPRRDVAIELKDRFQNIFTKNKIGLIYGGHTSNLYGDLICLTTHQLYRYDHYFDLLILDEVDAFPYKDNKTLESFFYRSLKGHYIFLSATPSISFLEKFKKGGGQVLELYSRFHRHPLPVPKVLVGRKILLYFNLIKIFFRFKKMNKQMFIFTPTIELCEKVCLILKIFDNNGTFVHSKCIDRSKKIQDFRNKKYQYLVTTAVLERGVTVSDLQVIIFNADHKIYDRYSLVQIAGRVGRKADHPDGEVYYVANKKTIEIEESIKDIRRANESLQAML